MKGALATRRTNLLTTVSVFFKEKHLKVSGAFEVYFWQIVIVFVYRGFHTNGTVDLVSITSFKFKNFFESLPRAYDDVWELSLLLNGLIRAAYDISHIGNFWSLWLSYENNYLPKPSIAMILSILLQRFLIK